MDALDRFEDLTEFGYHLVDLPIEPRLGKMILMSIFLKCLDPVLTITCTLAYKDPCKWPNLINMSNEKQPLQMMFFFSGIFASVATK